MNFSWKIIGVGLMCLSILLAVYIIYRYPQLYNLVKEVPMVLEQRPVDYFNKISYSGVGDLEIIQTGVNALTISSAQDIVTDIQTKVEDKTLVINYKWDWLKNKLSNQRPVQIQVQIADLSEINITGAGKITGPLIKSASLKLIVSGASRAELSVQTPFLTTELTGGARILLAGTADFHKINISGAATYDSQNLTSQDIDLAISGLGIAKVSANRNLNINITGGGKVYYQGNPKITQKITGLGSVYRDE